MRTAPAALIGLFRTRNAGHPSRFPGYLLYSLAAEAHPGHNFISRIPLGATDEQFVEGLAVAA